MLAGWGGCRWQPEGGASTYRSQRKKTAVRGGSPEGGYRLGVRHGRREGGDHLLVPVEGEVGWSVLVDGCWRGGLAGRRSEGLGGSGASVFTTHCVLLARGRGREGVGGEVLWCVFSSTVGARIGTQFRIEPLWMVGLVQDNQVSKKSRVAGGWASSATRVESRKKRKTIQEKTSDKRARAWPFEVFVLALGKAFFAQPTGHCRNVPVLSQGQRVRDELGMRQGAKGGGLPASVCAMISTPGSARGHEGKEPAVRSFSRFAGPVRGRTLSGHEGLKSEALQEKFDVWLFGRWSTHLGPFPLRLVLPHRESWPTLKVLSESLAGVSAHHPQTRGRL